MIYFSFCNVSQLSARCILILKHRQVSQLKVTPPLTPSPKRWPEMFFIMGRYKHMGNAAHVLTVWQQLHTTSKQQFSLLYY